MLQSRAKYTAFSACQSFQRIIFAMVLNRNFHHRQMGYSKLVCQKQLRKVLLLVYFRLVFTSAYIQVWISLSPLPHGAASGGGQLWHESSSISTIHNAWLIMGNWSTILLWSSSTKSWSRIVLAVLLICTDAFPWNTHQKLESSENC